MSGKIFKAIWTAAIAVFLASLVFIMGICYYYFSSLQKHQLRNEVELAARGVSLTGMEYFTGLREGNYRITWIDQGGEVLYDSQANFESMENHLEREEVKKAIREGYGEAQRYSSTLADKQLYAAKRLADGTILRLSIDQVAIWTLILGFAQPICLVFFLALLFSFLLALRLTKRIVKPINEIDIQHSEDYYGREGYEELEPLLRHISHQRTQLKQDQEEIERMALIRQEFTANVSHELKTPLQSISGYAELIESGLVREEDIKPFALRIRRETSRMAKLVEDIIELTRLDNGGEEQTWEEVDLYRIVQNALDSLEAVASAEGVKVLLEGKSAPMEGAAQMLYSIAYNLCDNGIKYNHKGGKVLVSVEPLGDKVLLRVKDTGIGIPAESLERIFERFYCVDKSHSKEVGGTGLGLSIVKHAVLIHQGEIQVHSQVGQGSEFEVILPGRASKEAGAKKKNEQGGQQANL